MYSSVDQSIADVSATEAFFSCQSNPEEVNGCSEGLSVAPTDG